MRRGRAAGAVAAVIASLMLIGAASASAANFTVNDTGDQSDATPGDGHCDWDTGTMGDQCTLRAAIQEAEAFSGADAISFITPASSAITLGSALPVITGDLSISGPGASDLTVDGADNYRVFHISSGTVSISGLTIAHGSSSFGGGIWNEGTLSLTNTVVDSNRALATGGLNAFPDGGGIENDGTLTITLSTISNNQALATGATNQNVPTGGGIYEDGSALTIDRSSLTGNLAAANAMGGNTANAIGGGISMNDDTVNIHRSTLSGNEATGTGGTVSSGFGGAIDVPFSTATVTIDRSTLAGNSATTQGGGIEAAGGTAVTSSTIAENSSLHYSNADVVGTTFKNTIISNPGGTGSNCGGNATSLGYNLESDAPAGSCNFSPGNHDILGMDPMLDLTGPVPDDNGGPTQTIALQAGSPAIDKGLSSAGETTDQRGLYRPLDFLSISNASGGNGTDIGAFETQATSPPGTKITSHSKHRTHSHHATVHFANTSIGPAAFQCRVNHEGWKSCHSAKRFHLKVGHNTFRVRAIVAGLTDSSPAEMTFKRLR